MNEYRYRITVEPLPRDGESSGEPIVFEAATHDDLAGIMDKLKADPRFGPEIGPAFPVGLKLLGETLLARRKEEPFASMAEHFGQIMRIVKQGRRA